MTEVRDDAYDFYPCLVDGEPASIYVNLRFEHERSDADTRYWIAVAMRDAGPYGIGTADEAAALDAVELAAIARARELGLVYVGRLRTHGVWEVTFYGPAGHVEALRDAASTRADARRVEAGSQHDPAWSYYRELLLPDRERRQWMDDRRMVQVLAEQGDDPRRPRRVDHALRFASARARDAFVATAARAGFTLDRASEVDEPELPFAAHVFRTDAVELDHIHEVVMTLVDAAEPHGGRYAGWTAGIER